MDGAIHRKAGPGLKVELRKIRQEKFPNGLPAGKAVITKGHDLPAKFVIHTVGPRYDPNKDTQSILISCFRQSLDLAEKEGLESIAFPAISTGAYGYPVDECAKAAKIVFDRYEFKSIEKVIISVFSPENRQVFLDVFKN